MKLFLILIFSLDIISIFVFSFYDYENINKFMEKICNKELSKNIIATIVENKQDKNDDKNSDINKKI